MIEDLGYPCKTAKYSLHCCTVQPSLAFPLLWQGLIPLHLYTRIGQTRQAFLPGDPSARSSHFWKTKFVDPKQNCPDFMWRRRKESDTAALYGGHMALSHDHFISFYAQIEDCTRQSSRGSKKKWQMWGCNSETFLRLPRVAVSGLEGHFAFKVEQFNISEKSLLKSSRFPMASTSSASIALSKLSDA